jgi:hypothetical protein
LRGALVRERPIRQYEQRYVEERMAHVDDASSGLSARLQYRPMAAGGPEPSPSAAALILVAIFSL